MSRDESPGRGRGRRLSDRVKAVQQVGCGLENAIDAAGNEPLVDDEEMAHIEAWLRDVVDADVLRRARLPDETIEMISTVLPDASITSELRGRMARRRKDLRAEWVREAQLESQCSSPSPSHLLRQLRERAGLATERVAKVFAIAPSAWDAVERQQSPWYRLKAESLPAFADAVGEPLGRLVELLALTARRSVLAGVQRRARLALGRFDETSEGGGGQLDTLRMAFARMQDENRGAAEFLRRAQKVAMTVHEPRSDPPRRPEGGKQP